METVLSPIVSDCPLYNIGTEAAACLQIAKNPPDKKNAKKNAKNSPASFANRELLLSLPPISASNQSQGARQGWRLLKRGEVGGSSLIVSVQSQGWHFARAVAGKRLPECPAESWVKKMTKNLADKKIIPTFASRTGRNADVAQLVRAADL